nr:coiled-coil and C2 domain-containing protein 2A isoform X2 [Helicoverpa armigera]
MNENIELSNFTADDSLENDIQEYHEIKQDTTLDDIETSFSSKQSPKHLNEYDFFTQIDVKTEPKKHFKKKKGKKKDKPSNLMDLISSEIAASVVPVTDNVVSLVDVSKERQNSYLRTNTKFTPFQKPKTFVVDAENGWAPKAKAAYLSPIFPRILENAVSDDSPIAVEYVDPRAFDDVVAKHTERDKDDSIKFLDITIKNITPKHHHSFTLEKLLCVKVVEYYNEYIYIQRVFKELAKDIKVSRDTKDNLKIDLMKVSPSKKYDVRFDKTLRNYTEKLLKLKEKYKESLKAKKEATHKIISLWADVEMLRERRECIDTPYNLELNQIILDETEYEKEWNDVFNTEYTDTLDQIEYDFVSRYLEYKEAKNEQNTNTDKKLSKPKLQFDEDKIKNEVEMFVNTVLTKSQVELYLKKDESILTDFEQQGQRFPKTNYNFLMYVDDVFVCESENYSSDDMFCAEFTESFSVQILAKNKSIRIVLLENGTKVSDFKINLQEVRKTNENAEFVAESLIREEIVESNLKYVGSGVSMKEIAHANKVRLKSSNLFKGKLFTNYEINMKVGWNDKLDQNKSQAVKSSMELGNKIKRLLHGIEKPNLDVLLDVISKIYEKEVTDENMIETITKLCQMEVQDDDTFPLEDNNPEITRLKLLHLRNIGGFTGIDKKLVPLHASQITTDQLNCLQKTNEKEFDMDYLNNAEMEMDPIELQRFIGAKYVQKLNRNMLRSLNEYLLQKTHKDVVKEFNFSFRSLFSNQSNVGVLATASNSTKQQILRESLGKDQEIHVTVIRAFNLLDRTAAVLDEIAEDDEMIAGFKVRSLRPFVRVNYRGTSAQTVTAIGCHPAWNHTLKINTKLEPLSSVHINIYDEYKANIVEGFSEEDHSNKTVHYRYYNKWLGTLEVPLYAVLSLGTLRGTFKITTPPLLFGYETHQTKESTSLIPEITQLMKKHTTFITLEITTSLSHLGGLHAYNQPLPSSIEDDYLIKHLNNFVTEYTNEFPMRNISLTFIDSAGRNKCVTQFLQPIPLPEKDFIPKNPRGDSAISKSSGFSKSSSSSGKRRERELDVDGMSHEEKESIYSAREGDNLSKMMNACMRYVSLIPSYEVTETHAVTLLGLELLKVLHGSPLDHTILLASYFIYLGIKCWVAIGLGLPRGQSSFVLFKYDLTTRRIVLESDQLFRSRGFLNKGDGYTWYVCDASSGERHELRDVGCPMKTVDYVFDNENIWVNVQASQDCENMGFDFTKSSEWQAVFDKSVFVMKQPVVTDSTLYSPPPSVEGLRVALENKIKMKVQKWRSHMKTIWNRYCSTLLRDMLLQWEYWVFFPTGPKPVFSQKLKHLMVTFKIFGFPLNMSYVNTKSVISAVKSTGLHLTDDPNVEFALGVEVCAYPNNVISVWVFLASISRM